MVAVPRPTRIAALAAVALALILAGTAVGAAGGALILGAANSAGTTNTSLTTATNSGTAFLVTQNGTATALRGVATNGIAGFFTSANGSGVSGVVANLNSYGVYAANDAASTGTGAALRAAGKNNYAVVATSDDKAPIKVVGPIGMAPFEVNSTVLVTNLNADNTDGWSFGCPSGTTYSQGLCFEQTNRAAQNVYGAADTCAGLGGIFGQIYRWRLPTIHQLRSARDAYLIALDASGEHTDSLHDFWNGASSQTNSWTVFDNGTLGDVVGGTARNFRCVTSPYSYFQSFIILSEQDRYPEPPTYGPAGVDAQGLVTD